MSSREEFEAWASKQKLCLTYGDCGYVFSSTEMAWRAWQAQETKCAALAAENAALKSFGDKLAEMHNDLNGEGTGIQGRAEVACQQVALEAAMEEFDAIKTPATDAFLAELRAQGGAKALEDFAEFNIKSIDPFDDEYTAVLKETARAARGFAVQLRQDANTAELVAAGIITKVGE